VNIPIIIPHTSFVSPFYYRRRCYSVHARDRGHETLTPYDRGPARAARATRRPFRICQIDRTVGAFAGENRVPGGQRGFLLRLICPRDLEGLAISGLTLVSAILWGWIAFQVVSTLL
jgi:hypothetical protein